MSKLLKCPFCGGESEVGYTNQHDKLFVVGCNTPMCYGNINHFTMVFVSKESAINTWNTRKPMDNIVEKLKELKEKTGCEGVDCGKCQYTERCWSGEMSYMVTADKAINIVKQEIGEIDNEPTNN